MNYEIVELSIDDIESYVRINSLAWKQSYKGIVNDDFLDLINSEEGINKSINNLKSSINNKFLLKVDGKYLGLFKIGKSKYEKYSSYGELGALYLLDAAKGKGFGKILFNRAIEELKKLGYKDMVIGCLKGNPSNEFYKHMGGELVDHAKFNIAGQELEENIYLYKID